MKQRLKIGKFESISTVFVIGFICEKNNMFVFRLCRLVLIQFLDFRQIIVKPKRPVLVKLLLLKTTTLCVCVGK